MGCIGLFEVRDVVCPELVCPFYANFETLYLKGRGELVTPPRSRIPPSPLGTVVLC